MIKTSIITVFCFFAFTGKTQRFSDTLAIIFERHVLFSKLVLEPELSTRNLFTDWLEQKANPVNVIVYDAGFQHTSVKYPDQLAGGEPYNWTIVHTRNDSIFFAEIVEIKLYPDSTAMETIYTKADTLLIDRYVDQHNELFHAEWTRNDFLTSRKEELHFGFFCQPFMPHSENTKKLAAFVKNRDKQKLRGLASSFSPSQRAAGVVGLFFLEQEGVQLSAEEMEIMKVNQQSNEVIYNCETRFYPGEELSTILTGEKLVLLYKTFKFHQLL